MEKGFASVVPTKKSEPGQNGPQPIWVQDLQASFSTYFDDLPDPRVERTKQHLLKDIIVITIHRCHRRSPWMGRHRKLWG